MTTGLLTLDQFGDKVGDVFVLEESGARPVELTLIEAEALPKYDRPAVPREPFSLLFTTSGDFVLPQRMYALRHAGLGSVAVFLVPIGRARDKVTYQAIFN